MSQQTDVLIMGGGLAGLCLAIQLRREQPALTVCVLERASHPPPVAAFKVGESSVEIGAHYFDTVLGLKAHLDTQQLRKFGLRFFFCDGEDDIERATELGVSEVFPTPSYQLDRGLFEAFLALHAEELGARFLDRGIVRHIDLDAQAGHRVRYERDGADHTVQARWIVDASGRAGLLKRKLGLELRNNHDANAIWFRLSDRLRMDDWGSDAWRAQCRPPERWRSTNHLCGPGYWAWLIPLSSGSHSIGIVADATLHPLETINSYDKAMNWLAQHQPRLHREIEAHPGTLQDFAFLRHFSHDCKQVFSADRWAITGIAGVFLDPFYSPGSDFIAISNTYIADLIGRDFRGEPFARPAKRYEQLYFSFYRNTLAMYEGQYPMFGHSHWMPVKIVWDYAYYWGVLCPFFFQRRLTDVALFAHLAEPLEACAALNREIQALLREAAGAGQGPLPPGMVDQSQFEWFGKLNRSLQQPLNDGQLQAQIRANAELLTDFAAQIRRAVAQASPEPLQRLFARMDAFAERVSVGSALAAEATADS